MALTDKAMIVRLNVSQWTTNVFDRPLTNKTARDNHIDVTRVKASKSLVAKESIEKISKVSGALRNYHYKVTLPWDDSNGRLLPCDLFMDYQKEIDSFRAQFDAAVDEFLSAYPRHVQDARAALNGAFDPAQYPTVDRLRRKYRIETAIEPIPLSSDFRVTLNSTEFDRVKRELTDAMQSRQAQAMADLYGRLYDVVNKFAEKMRDPKAIFRDSLIENVAELAQLLPALNIVNDPHLEALRKDVVQKIASIEPDNMRKDADARQAAAETADSILSKLSGFIGGDT